MTEGDRYRLRPRYAEFGGVHCVDLTTGTEFVLRSTSALHFEQGKKDRTEALFSVDDMRRQAAVSLLIYHFGPGGLRLRTAPAFQRNARGRYELGGSITEIGVWTYAGLSDDLQPFDQGFVDRFDEVARIDDDEVDEQK